MSDRDFDFETSPGIPAPLPKGEEILWQGSPDAKALAREAFSINWIAGYMAAVVLLRGLLAFYDGGFVLMVAVAVPYVVLAFAAYAVIYALAWAQARAAIYTITSARVILRIGAALPVTYNVPFTCITAASLATTPSGTGTIALETKGNMRLSFAVLWPHVRPWHARHTQPAFRAIPDATRVARILADAAQSKLNEPVIERRTAGAASGMVAAE